MANVSLQNNLIVDGKCLGQLNIVTENGDTNKIVGVMVTTRGSEVQQVTGWVCCDEFIIKPDIVLR